MLFSQGVKIFASYRQMKLEPDLTYFQASDKETDLTTSGTMQVKLRCLLPSTHTANILHRYTVWFFLKDEEFVSKTINDSNIDLEKFPASKVRQLAKETEFLKSTAKHIKAVASDPKVTCVNLFRHQRTDLHFHKQRSESQKRYFNEHKNQRPPFKKFDQAKHINEEINVQSVVISSMEKVSTILPRSSSARSVTNMVILPACATKSNHLLSQETLRHTSCKQE